MVNGQYCYDDISIFDGQEIAPDFAVPSSSKYSRGVTKAVNADLNVYRMFVRLGHLISQRDCRLFKLLILACASSSKSSSA